MSDSTDSTQQQIGKNCGKESFLKLQLVSSALPRNFYRSASRNFQILYSRNFQKMYYRNLQVKQTKQAKVLENFLRHNFFPFVVETMSVESDIKCYTPSCRLWKVETFKRTRRRYIHKSSIRKKWKVRNVNQTQHKFDKKHFHVILFDIFVRYIRMISR